MFPIRVILHPTDFSKQSEYAFRLACSLAKDYGARLHAVHVMATPMVIYGEGIVPARPEGYEQEQREKLQKLQDPAVHVQHRLVEGDPVMEILRVAKETGSDLIVMGTHGWTGLTRLLMGSVAEGVVRKAPCPVLTVKTPVAEAKPAPVLASQVLQPV